MSRQLLNAQRKQLHDILVSEGVNPALTKWTNDQKEWTSGQTDTLEVGLCYFLINPDVNNGISIKARPAPDGGVVFGTTGLDWHDVLMHFRSWVRNVKIEIDQEDPWEKYIKISPPQQLLDFKDNSPFSYKEAQQAEAAISKLITFLHENIDDYDKVAERFDDSLNRMAEHAKSGLGRIDWANQFVGLIMTLCLALSLSPGTANEIWNFWIDTVSSIYQLFS